MAKRKVPVPGKRAPFSGEARAIALAAVKKAYALSDATIVVAEQAEMFGDVESVAETIISTARRTSLLLGVAFTALSQNFDPTVSSAQLRQELADA